MKAFEQLERLQRMNRLIANRCTGTPAEFAVIIGISERRLFATIEEMKDMGVEIMYSRSEETYYFKKGYGIEIECSMKIISEEQMKIIFGGWEKTFPAFFTQRSNIILHPA